MSGPGYWGVAGGPLAVKCPGGLAWGGHVMAWAQPRGGVNTGGARSRGGVGPWRGILAGGALTGRCGALARGEATWRCGPGAMTQSRMWGRQLAQSQSMAGGRPLAEGVGSRKPPLSAMHLSALNKRIQYN